MPYGVPCSLPSRITTSLEKLQDFFFKTESKTKTKIVRDQLIEKDICVKTS